MAKIETYTQQVAPAGIPQIRNASASDLSGGAGGLANVADAMEHVSEKVRAVEERRNNRLETINHIRGTEGFYSEAFNEFNRSMSEEDLVNPATVEKFRDNLEKKAADVLGSFQGSPEAKIKFEGEIINHVGNFTRQLTQNSIAAQRKFVMGKAGNQISALAKQARDNPSTIGDIYKNADKIIGEMSPALYPEDEMALIEAAHESIALGALQSYTDSGQFEDARDLINENPFFLQSLSEGKQKEILKTIDSGLAEKDKAVKEMRNKMDAIRGAAKELGIEVSGEKVFAAVTGMSDAQTPSGKIDEFAKALGKSPDELTPSMIAKVGFGVDLGGAETDFNKEYTPDGNLTPKGVAAQIKEPFEKATAARLYQEQVNGAISQFRNDGNKQALLTAMIKYQKALDEGAVVREGDIVLQREAQGLIDKLNKWQQMSGQVVGDELVNEMESSINNFTMKALESSLAKIDPYVRDAKERGYRSLDYGVPDEAYMQVFGGVKAPGKPAAGGSKSTMSADEFLAQ
jgi:hypothetical protein